MSATILDRILEHKRVEVAQRREHAPENELRARACATSPARPFALAMRRRIDAGAPAVIAEVKKASPSKGVIRADFDPVAIAESYARGGATCLSVLTDERFFQGADRFLVAAREASGLPTLRKDFVVDAYQIYESRALGADCILLIAAALDPQQLTDLFCLARETGLDVLVEVHDRAELERAVALPAPLIGINNRDLRSFETRLSTTYDLLPYVPNDVTVVTESGIHERAHVTEMRGRGVHAFLVGEAFMRAADPGQALRHLFFEQD